MSQIAETKARDASYAGSKTLILGGLGFIGSNLARLLVEAGAEVTLVDNFLPDHGANWFNLDGIQQQVRVHLADIRSAEALNQLVQHQQVIFNLAAQTSHSDSMRDPLLDLDINGRGNLTFLEACRRYNPQARIVFVGTRAFYGTPRQLPVDEDAALSPQDVYAVDRLAAEQHHLVYHLHYDLAVTSLRLGNLYGPRGQMQHPRYNVLNYFIRMALEQRRIQIYGPGQQRRDYIYVVDACEALLKAGLSQQTGRVYNIGAGQAYGFAELVQKIIQLTGQGDYAHVDWPQGAKAFDVGDFVYDISRARQELDWQPQTSIEEGLRRTIEFYRNHSQHYWS